MMLIENPVKLRLQLSILFDKIAKNSNSKVNVKKNNVNRK